MRNDGAWRCQSWVCMGLMLIGGTFTAPGQSNTRESLQRELNAQVVLTTVTADRRQIESPGVAGALRVSGLVMYNVASPAPPSSTYKEGRIVASGGDMGRNLLLSMASPDGTRGYPQRRFVAGERCWVTDLAVHKDAIVLTLYSDEHQGDRYYGKLKLPFPDPAHIPDLPSALRLLGEVMDADFARDIAVGDMPLDARPAPPEPPPSAPPSTTAARAVSWGMSKERVIAAIGQPATQTRTGFRETLVYPAAGIKVTFTNGLVSNISAAD